MSASEYFVGRRQHLGGEKVIEVPPDYVEVYVSPIVIAGDKAGEQFSVGWFEIAKLIGLRQRNVEVEVVLEAGPHLGNSGLEYLNVTGARHFLISNDGPVYRTISDGRGRHRSK